MVKRDASRRVGRYLIVRELGSGGMATVYLARHLGLDRLVALKELSSVRRGDPAFAQRFLRESRVAGSLNHPNIVTVYDYFQREGTPYIAMEYVPGGSLRQHVGRGLTPAQVGGVLGNVLAGLAHAERRGIVHRDLKPENLLIDEDGQVKIADFGIAKATYAVQASVALTTTGTTLGTPSYMSPEQATGDDVGPQSDLYSLGIVAFELLVGHVPFADTEAPMAVLMRQINDPVPPVRSVRRDVDQAVSDWVGRLLVKDPARRTASALPAWRELDEALTGWLGPRWKDAAALPGGEPYATPAFETPATAPTARADQRTVAPHTTPPTVRAPRSPARRSWGGVAAVAVLLALVAGVLALSRARGPQTAADTQATPSSGAVVSSRALRLAVPDGWRRVHAVPATGLPVHDAIAVAPRGHRGGGDGPAIVAGMMTAAAAGTSALLPASYVSSLGLRATRVPPRDAVTLSQQQLAAWRYRDLRPLGSTRAVTVFVVPTDAGVATVACLAPKGAEAADRESCEAVAPTLELRRAKPYPTGPSDAYAAALQTTLATLHQETTVDARALATAATGPERARTAGALAADYGRAARRFARLTISPADRAANAELMATLRRVARAYSALAGAARKGSPAAVERRRQAAAAAAGSVDGALAALRAAGYAGGGAGAGAGGSGGAGESQGTTAPQGSTAPQNATPPRRPARPRPAPRTSSCGGDEQSDDPSDDEGDCGGEA